MTPLVNIVELINKRWDSIVSYLTSKGYRIITNDDINESNVIERVKQESYKENEPVQSLLIEDKRRKDKRYEIFFVTTGFYEDNVVYAAIPIVKIDRTEEAAKNNYVVYLLEVYNQTDKDDSCTRIEVLGGYKLKD